MKKLPFPVVDNSERFHFNYDDKFWAYRDDVNDDLNWTIIRPSCLQTAAAVAAAEWQAIAYGLADTFPPNKECLKAYENIVECLKAGGFIK